MICYEKCVNFRKRGCDFFEDDEKLKKYSDVGNYRVYSHCVGINGINYHLEFQRGFKNEINNLGGYREKNILSNCILTQLIQDDNNYEVIRFIDNNKNYFDYEAKSKRIVG